MSETSSRKSDAGQSDVVVSHEESLRHPVVDAARKAVREALEDHKRAGNPIAGWRDGRVVLIPPEEIEV